MSQMSQWVKYEKIKVSVEKIKFFSVFMIHNDPRHERRTFLRTRDWLTTSNRAQTSTHQMSKNDCSHIWVFEY